MRGRSRWRPPGRLFLAGDRLRHLALHAEVRPLLEPVLLVQHRVLPHVSEEDVDSHPQPVLAHVDLGSKAIESRL